MNMTARALNRRDDMATVSCREFGVGVWVVKAVKYVRTYT